MSFKRGFTVVEVMLVVTIISVLSVVTISFVSLSRDRAKDAKVQQEKVLVKGVIEAYAAEHGGYPRSDVDTKRTMYCIGSVDCMVDGRPVSTYLNPQTGAVSDSLPLDGFVLGDLIGYTDESGFLSQGFVYVSCPLDEPDCEEGVIYSQSGDEWISYFDGTDEELEDEDDFDFIGIDLDDYPRRDVDDNPDPDTYSSTCRESDYPNNYGAFLLSGSCEESQSAFGTWYCSDTCANITGQYTICNPNNFPGQSGSFNASGWCQYGPSQNEESVYCTGITSCGEIPAMFPHQCNYDNNSGCYQEGNLFMCRESYLPCNGGGDGGDPDFDLDEVWDPNDNCINVPNGPYDEDNQGDMDGDGPGDGTGDACDPDIDGDGTENEFDADPRDPNVQ